MSISIDIRTRRDGTRYFDFDGEIHDVDHRGLWKNGPLTYMGVPQIKNDMLCGFMVGAEPDDNGYVGNPAFQNAWHRVTYACGTGTNLYTPRDKVL